MSKQFGWLWLLAFAGWGVAMCWISGYRAGITAGNEQAWNSFRHARSWDHAMREVDGDEEELRRISLAH